jgi:nicotinamidase-related amidase
MSITLLIIDPQVDFCDPERGALYVPGAEQDMARLAEFVRRMYPEIDAIHVTLDSHHVVDIAHPVFWVDADGRHPAPFTSISAEEIETGRWTTTKPEMRARALNYARTLEQGGRYALLIWPYHCLIGSPGHAVQPELFAALQEWEQNFAMVNYILKGRNPWTEHYSAIRAEVPDKSDPETLPQSALIQALEASETLLVAGEAGSHCVANTVRDLADQFSDPAHISRLCLLTDAVSPVTGFEGFQEQFLAEMTARGMRLTTTTDFRK